MIPEIIDVKYLADFRLWMRFNDGLEGELDLAQLLRFDGIFKPLADKGNFAEVRLNEELGTICWPNGADLAPEVLYSRLTAQLGSLSA